ncbi:MAG: DUF1819 family protein [Blastocatellia bacterium]|nr:DUF1819 family protein [Blastocatellia bacterium]
MKTNSDRIYSSKIIKAGALLADTRTLFANWDEAASVSENLTRFRRENIFGKASRSRVEDILAIFRQRYLTAEHLTKSLAVLVKGGFPTEGLDRIFYFHAAQSDKLLHDIVTEVLLPLQQQGRDDVLIEDIQRVLARWVDEGKTTGRWSEYTILRVAQGLLSALRDFGVLRGATNKQLGPMFLPVEAFAYVAFNLRQNQPSGERLIDHSEWRLFFLSRESVEHFFMEAHQRRLLEYHAAGSIIRISFPAESVEEYAHVIVERSHRTS